MGSEVSKSGETAYKIDMSESGWLHEGNSSEVFKATRIFDEA
jgi:hypothetical protein